MNIRSLFTILRTTEDCLLQYCKLLISFAVITLLVVSCSSDQESQLKTQVVQAGQTIVAEEVASAKTKTTQLFETAEAQAVTVLTPKTPQLLGPYTIDTNLNVVDEVTGAELDNAIKAIRPDSGLIGLGQTFVDVGKSEGINPIYIAAHAAWESSWGTSKIFKDKNNLFGYGAFDRAPYESALKFNTKEEGVKHAMTLIKQNYLIEGGKYYKSPTLKGMNINYATDPNWANGIAKVMNLLAGKINSQRSE